MCHWVSVTFDPRKAVTTSLLYRLFCRDDDDLNCLGCSHLPVSHYTESKCIENILNKHKRTRSWYLTNRKFWGYAVWTYPSSQKVFFVTTRSPNKTVLKIHFLWRPLDRDFAIEPLCCRTLQVGDLKGVCKRIGPSMSISPFLHQDKKVHPKWMDDNL